MEQTTETGKFRISSEDDLIAAINGLRSGELDGATILFDQWPRWELTIRGERFDGGVPTRVMPAILDFQRQIYRAHEDILGRRLTREERRKTELVVRFERGRSTTFLSDLWPVLNTLAQQVVTKMDGHQLMLSVMSLAAIAGGVFVTKYWLANTLEKKKVDADIKLSEEETRRYQMIADIAEASIQTQKQIMMNQENQLKLLGSLVEGDYLSQQNQTLIDGTTAKMLRSQQSSEPTEGRIDGEFRILTVESGSMKKGFKLKVTPVNEETSETLTVDVPEGTLSADQIKTLQAGEWEKRALHLKINLRKRGDKIIGATLIEAGLKG